MKIARSLLIVTALLFPACGQHEETSGSRAASLPAVPVKTAKAERRLHTSTEDAMGTVRSKKRAVLEARVSGRVSEYSAVPGQSVKSGETLAVLEVQEIQARLDQAKAAQNQAARDFARQQQLLSGNATTRQEFDAAEARVKVASAAVQEAETMLGYARVTAPFDGIVTRKLAEAGDLAMPGKPLVEIESPGEVRFETDLPEALIERVKLGTKLSVRISNVAGALEGTVSEISPVADAVSRTYLVKLDLPKHEALRPGQFGRISVPVKDSQILLIPKSAVLQRGQMELVHVVKDGRAALRLVKTGRTLDGGTEILSGLEDGEQIVASAPGALVDGQPVTVTP